jgi:hypothetical protein
MPPLDPSQLCPVCGYDNRFAPWEDDSPSHEICASCGIEFGYDDIPEGGGLEGTREEIYAFWRERWIGEGMQWFSSGTPIPPGWDPRLQLRRIGVQL